MLSVEWIQKQQSRSDHLGKNENVNDHPTHCLFPEIWVDSRKFRWIIRHLFRIAESTQPGHLEYRTNKDFICYCFRRFSCNYAYDDRISMETHVLLPVDCSQRCSRIQIINTLFSRIARNVELTWLYIFTSAYSPRFRWIDNSFTVNWN